MAKKAKQQTLKPTNADPDKVAACYSEYASLMADQRRGQQRIAAMLGRYEKGDGVDPKTIKRMYGLSSKDPAEAKRQHERDVEYMRILGIVEFDDDGQGTFGGAMPPGAPKPNAEYAQMVLLVNVYNDGYNSGLAGGKIDACTHAPGSKTFVRWRDGFADGHADRLAKNPDADKETKAEPRKRGRRAVVSDASVTVN